MKKQKIFAISIVTIMVALVVGGTSAFFTYSDKAHNVITTSGVAIELIEDTEDVGGDGRPIPFTDIEGAMPGDKISKIPKIKNVDDGDVYVRMKVVASVSHVDGIAYKISLDTFELDLSRSWGRKDNDGYFYYMRTLHAGETTTPLFTTVTIPSNLGDRYQHSKFALQIRGEAVQAANNGTGPLDAEGWPEG